MLLERNRQRWVLLNSELRQEVFRRRFLCTNVVIMEASESEIVEEEIELFAVLPFLLSLEFQ